MRRIAVRYEVALINRLTKPFEVGLRHLKVAFCDGTDEKLIQLAKERIIYRPFEETNKYAPLTIGQRLYHGIVGMLETIGYLTLIVPYIVQIADRCFCKPWYPKGCYAFRTNMAEGGSFETKVWRKNPFDDNGAEDPFYHGASWLKTTTAVVPQGH